MQKHSAVSKMSFVDFNQCAEDHRNLVILIKQVGTNLRSKALNYVYDCITKNRHFKIASNQRAVHVRFVRSYHVENAEWGDFQAHRKVLGLISVGKCKSEDEVQELHRLHENLKQQYSGTLFDSRLILLGLNQDGSALERSLQGSTPNSPSSPNPPSLPPDTHLQTKSSTTSQASSSDSTDSQYFSDPLNVNAAMSEVESAADAEKINDDGSNFDLHDPTSLLPKGGIVSHILCYPTDESCASSEVERKIQEFVESLFWVLESKRLDRRSLEKQDRLALLTTPFEKKDMVGIDTDTRIYRKRCQGRLRKYLGDLCLLANVASEAIAHYQTALDILRSANDWLWLGAAYEGLCASTVIMSLPADDTERTGLYRNQSFSVRSGSSAIREAKQKSDVPDQSSLGKNLGNGLAHMEAHSQVNCLPPDITDKYKEAVTQYGKFKNAGIIEMEASLKACRVLISQQKLLAAADFLQNVVYINITITEEEKTERFLVLSKLYGDVGMIRKAGFYKRISAMQSVAPSNTSPAWTQCYRTLLEACRCYGHTLDVKDRNAGANGGWPLVQLRVLHELIYSARKMGNPAVAIRHLSYLLHTMTDHLTEEEMRELCAALESYTARCEGTPQTLALEDGTILPPVPLTKFPTVKGCKLVECPPHFKPISYKKTNDAVKKHNMKRSPFIYSPLQLHKVAATDKRHLKMPFSWVQGDVCEVSVQVYNPLPFELRCSNMGLLTDGVPLESYPANLGLPPASGPFHVKVMGMAREAGKLTILGYSTTVLGVRNHCRFRDMPHIPENTFEIEVVPSLPQLQVSTSLPKAEFFSSLADSDSVITSATACIYAGQNCECQIKLVNNSKIAVEKVDLLLDSKVDAGILHKVLKWDQASLDAQLPIEPGQQASVTVYIHGISNFITPAKLRPPAEVPDAGLSGFQSSTNLSTHPAAAAGDANDSSWLCECLLRIQYSGGPGLVADYFRQCSIALTVEVKASVLINHWSVTPAQSADLCFLSLDLENQCSSSMSLSFGHNETLNVDAQQCRRIGLYLPQCNLVLTMKDSLATALPPEKNVMVTDSNPSHNALPTLSSHNVSGALDANTRSASCNSGGTLNSDTDWDDISGRTLNDTTESEVVVASGDSPSAMCRERVVQQLLTDHVVSSVDVRWSLPDEGESGCLHVDKLWWTEEQMAALSVQPLSWRVLLNGEHHKRGEVFELEVGQQVLIHCTVSQVQDVKISELSTEVTIDGESAADSMCSAGCLKHTNVSTMAEGEAVGVDFSLLFIHPGNYCVHFHCITTKLASIAQKATGSSDNTREEATQHQNCSYIPCLVISVIDNLDISL